MKFEICTERALLYGAFESPYQQSHSLRRPFYTHRTTLFGLDEGSLGFCGGGLVFFLMLRMPCTSDDFFPTASLLSSSFPSLPLPPSSLRPLRAFFCSPTHLSHSGQCPMSSS
jgi:hypothetical protein